MVTVDIISNIIAIFVFILIISGNYIGTLFPCKVQNILNTNIYVKHFLGFLTLIFFVLLTIPEFKDENARDILLNTTGLYASFLIISKVHYKAWFTILFLSGILYLLHIYTNNLSSDKSIELIKSIEWSIAAIIGVCTVFGFLIYMGEKKFEYGSKFEYITFLFGKSECMGQSPAYKGHFTNLMHAFAPISRKAVA